MNQKEPFLSLQCPKHPDQLIRMIDTDFAAKKFVYCYECIAESGFRGTIPKTIKPLEGYLKETLKLYEKYRERTKNTVSDLPLKYLEGLSKKQERLEEFSQHINHEKAKVKERFEEIRKIAMRIIDEKEKEFLQVLDKEILNLSASASYLEHEKLVFTKWSKPSGIQAKYPKLGILKEKICQIGNIDQLQAFVKEAQESLHIGNIKEDDLKTLESFIGSGSCLPKIESRLFGSENLESLMKDFMKGFIQQGIRIERSPRGPESKIINNEQLEILRDWLPNAYKLKNPKLLYRGSVVGMTPAKLHEKCDGKGPTITLIKCRFNDVEYSSIIGGFLDESWNASDRWTGSKEAFIFSLREKGNSVKCPVLEDHSYCAFYGSCQDGPVFGNGNDLFVANDFQRGSTVPRAYLGAEKLCPGKNLNFVVEDIEVLLVG